MKYFEVLIKKTFMSKFRCNTLKTEELVEASSSGKMLHCPPALSTPCSCSSLREGRKHLKIAHCGAVLFFRSLQFLFCDVVF